MNNYNTRYITIEQALDVVTSVWSEAQRNTSSPPPVTDIFHALISTTSISAKNNFSPREERLLKFFAEKWRKWHDPCNVSDPDGYKKTELSLAADDIDNFMVEEFESSWSEAKVEK